MYSNQKEMALDRIYCAVIDLRECIEDFNASIPNGQATVEDMEDLGNLTDKLAELEEAKRFIENCNDAEKCFEKLKEIGE